MQVITKTIEAFSFDELSEQAQEKAWDHYMQGFEFYYDSVVDDAKTIAELFGLDIDKIYFSGFWSQGSGACFTGEYAYKKGALNAVKDYAPNDTELHGIVAALQAAQKPAFYKLRAECTTSRNNNLQVNLSHSDNDYFDVQPYEDGIEQALDDFAGWIYSNLEREYEYQTSKEVISDFFSDYEYLFDANGNVLDVE